jgi:hypothetical protein
LDYCGYKLAKAQEFLRKTSKPSVKGVLKKYSIGEIPPMKLEEDNEKEESKLPVLEKKEEVFVPTGPNYFDLKLTKDTICYIFDFLDPSSLMRAGKVCKEFNKVTQIPLLYKKFCKANYKSLPIFPEKSPFASVVKRINNSTFGEFTTATKTKANQDIRSLIWLPNLEHYGTPTQFYKQFKDYRSIYLNVPRVRYGGVYLMKENYIRSGTREIHQQYDPLHEVEFYRYFRFFPNGLAMSCLCVNKLNKDKIKKIMTIKNLQAFEENESWSASSLVKSTVFGEFAVQKSKLFIKLCAKSTIYEFELEIGGTQTGMFNELKMVDQGMRIVGIDEKTPIQQDYRGSKIFKFVRVSSLLSELEGNWPNIAV